MQPRHKRAKNQRAQPKFSYSSLWVILALVLIFIVSIQVTRYPSSSYPPKNRGLIGQEQGQAADGREFKTDEFLVEATGSNAQKEGFL